MLSITRIDSSSDFSDTFSRNDFIDFLHTHLGRFRDSKEAIDRSIDYAFSDAEGNGGFLLAAHDERNAPVGAAVINLSLRISWSTSPWTGNGAGRATDGRW